MDTYQRLDKDELAELSRLKPWYSSVALVTDWMMIAAVITLTNQYFSIPLYIVCVLFIGGRQHALGILMHEATHFRFFRNRKLNDWIGEIFCAWPLLVTLHGYRKNHLAHHRMVNTMEDPDWVRKIGDSAFVFPKKTSLMWGDLAKAMFGVRFVREVRNVAASKDMKNIPTKLKRARLAFYILTAIMLSYFGVWLEFAIYWIVPLATCFTCLIYVRGVAEHHGGGMNYDSPWGGTRHIDANWFERLFIPHNINYHIGHHFYPAVPYYNLPKLHKKMLKDKTFATHAKMLPGYRSLFKECTQT